MPKVGEPIDGYQVKVYTRDEHPPAHVHVEKAGTKIKVLLGDDEVEYHSFKGRQPRRSEIDRATEIVAERLDACWRVWRANNERDRKSG
jgi:hypothetical protein